METEEETRRILEMLREGKITAEQAATLLEVLDISDQRQSSAPSVKAHTLRINVTDTRTGRAKVNVNIPLALVDIASKMGLTLGMKNVPELADLDFDSIMSALKSGAAGRIVDIEDDDDGQHVVVSIE
jgi:hypothetical protein